MLLFFLTFLSLIIIFLLGPRPKLDPRPRTSELPDNIDLENLSGWLSDYESSQGNVTPGAEATIQWFDGVQKQPLCLLYVHGFSATRQETVPVTDRVAKALGANLVYARLAGHGLTDNGLQMSAEDWLQSMANSWDIASRLGDRVVIVACSTGAPLSIWLAQQLTQGEKPHSLVFLSPNFKVRNPFGFLLTAPWSRHWIQAVIGKEHSWEPENEDAAKYWTHRYSTRALVEMQKLVDWCRRDDKSVQDIPLTTLYMVGDPTISHEAAISFHENWQSDTKALHQVTIDAESPQHVFVGNITAPQRVDWCVDTCVGFLQSVDPSPAPAPGRNESQV